jgi:hypothetical protein
MADVAELNRLREDDEVTQVSDAATDTDTEDDEDEEEEEDAAETPTATGWNLYYHVNYIITSSILYVIMEREGVYCNSVATNQKTKNRGTRTTASYAFADPHHGISLSPLGYFRGPKQSFEALISTCAAAKHTRSPSAACHGCPHEFAFRTREHFSLLSAILSPAQSFSTTKKHHVFGHIFNLHFS